MRRDADLIRELMLKLEALPTAHCSEFRLQPGADSMTVAGFSANEIEYHLRLIVEAGLITSRGRFANGDFRFDRMTWSGHDFVDSVRDAAIWARTKNGAEAAGGFTVDLLKDLAKGFIKKQIKDKTGIDL